MFPTTEVDISTIAEDRNAHGARAAYENRMYGVLPVLTEQTA
jgi:hypothetical protein